MCIQHVPCVPCAASSPRHGHKHDPIASPSPVGRTHHCTHLASSAIVLRVAVASPPWRAGPLNSDRQSCTPKLVSKSEADACDLARGKTGTRGSRCGACSIMQGLCARPASPAVQTVGAKASGDGAGGRSELERAPSRSQHLSLSSSLPTCQRATQPR